MARCRDLHDASGWDWSLLGDGLLVDVDTLRREGHRIPAEVFDELVATVEAVRRIR